jgi:hypothetical protein
MHRSGGRGMSGIAITTIENGLALSGVGVLRDHG